MFSTTSFSVPGNGARGPRRARVPFQHFFLLCFLAVCLPTLSACDILGSGGAPPTLEGHEGRYRTPLTDQASSVTALPDGSFLITGITEGRPRPADGTLAYPLLVQAQADGSFADPAVYRNAGFPYMRYGETLAATPLAGSRSEGDLAVLVEWYNDYSDAPGAGARRLVLYRTGANGERKEVTFERADTFGQDLLRTADGGLLLVVFRATAADADLIKLSVGGGVQWTYRMPEVQDVRSVSEAPDGDLFVAGVYSDSRRFAVARLRPDGAERWRRTYGSESSERLRRTTRIVAAREGAAVFGDRSIPASRQDSTIVTRLGGDGGVQWERTYGVGHMTPAAAALPDGGWAFGYTEDYTPKDEGSGIGSTRAYVVRLAPGGEQRRQQRFGPERGTTYTADMTALTGGQLAVVGSTGPERISGFGGDDFDVLAATYELE